MGSLVPGWDTDIGVPRDLVQTDIDSEPKPLGYFEKLRSHRHSTDVVADQAAAYPLARVSAPQPFARTSSKQSPPVPRANTLSHGGAGQPKYQMTDWTEELATLRPRGMSLGRSSMGAPGGAHKHDHEQEGGGAWWRSLEVGQLNEHPDAAQNFVHDTGKSTFVPQFTQSLSSRMDFGEGGEGKDKGESSK